MKEVKLEPTLRTQSNDEYKFLVIPVVAAPRQD